MLVTPWYPTPESPVEGVFVREHALALAEFADVVVVHVPDRADRHSRRPVIEAGHDAGLDTMHVSRPWDAGLRGWFAVTWSIFAARRALRARGFRPDVVNAHVATAAVPSAVVCALTRTPLVISEHWSRFLPADPGTFSARERRAIRWAFQRAAAVLPVSSVLAEAIRKVAPRARLRVVPNAVDCTLFAPPAQGRGAATGQILAVALLVDGKGLEHLLPAFAEVAEARPEATLHLVGDGAQRPRLEAMAADLGVGSRVTFHGSQTKAQIAGLMHGADVFVLPSMFETFGVVVVEALASGVPVVATRCGGPDDLVSPEMGLLVPPGDPHALSLAIQDVMTHRGDYDADALATYAREHFSRAAVAECLRGVLDDVLDVRSEEAVPR